MARKAGSAKRMAHYALIEDGSHEVGDLSARKTPALNTGPEPPLAIDHRGLEGVGDEPLVGPVFDAEGGADRSDGLGASGQESPARDVPAVARGEAAQDFGGVVLRIESDGQQSEVLPEPIAISLAAAVPVCLITPTGLPR